MTKTVAVGTRTIGPGHPCFLAAEVGTTSLGDVDRALALVEAGAAAGMDAVKFQLIDPDQLSDASVSYSFRSGGRTYEANMQEMFRRLAFTEDQWGRIAEACRRAGVVFYATVDFVAGVDLLERLGVPVHKLGAWDGTFRPLVERIGATGKPVFADLGPTTSEEVSQLVDWYRGAGGSAVLFLHDFHTGEDREMNLRAVTSLAAMFEWPAGFSAPGRDDDLDMAAIALGAHHLEKRLILDRNDRAFHADESLEPAELKAWVARVRHLERALGEGGIRPSRSDREQSRLYYRSICTLRPVRAGERFTPENLGGKRPGTGLPTRRLPEFWQGRARRDLPENSLVEPGDLA